ncbi:hypothetical protein GCM10010844_11550 [Deinococcus radiotolerans]|uniref:Transposase n=1 Tax=Deinococcus radiotolerans TaxID=1309407 RepID=A0ABQ2FG00_9DEIO|nr:hypothetical protein GCM10010844_11550 [Deinococcus radiotolerans]
MTANWTAVVATGDRKLRCIPDAAGHTDLTLRRIWQHGKVLMAGLRRGRVPLRLLPLGDSQSREAVE